MASPRDSLLRLAASNDRRLRRLEISTLRELRRVYQQARREILGIITERRNALYTGGPEKPEEIVLQALARDYSMLQQIEARMQALEREVARRLESAVRQAQDVAGDISREELDILLAGLDIPAFAVEFAAVDFASVEIGLEAALEAYAQSNRQLAALLKSELRVGMIRGESFRDLTQRLLGRDTGMFNRGQTSAALAARRNIITANNAARHELYKSWDIEGLGKQAIAAIDERTTDCCLRVHGQIQPIEKPYKLTGTPRFADSIMYPAFHWNCRTTSVAYHMDFEQGARVTTADMERAARDERRAREDGSREEIHPADSTSRRRG